MKTPATKRIHGEPSWRIHTADVEAWLTQEGGHLGPVSFTHGSKTVQPYSIAPWCGTKEAPDEPQLIRGLRGDFFCLPFGGNGTAWNGEKHPPHGATANHRWKLESHEGHALTASLKTAPRAGRVEKRLEIRAGHHAIYQRHTISGMSGPMSAGHHAMLKFPDEPESGIVATSRFVLGQVFPDLFEKAEHYGYQSLRPGETFRSLRSVTRIDGGAADISRFPARRGYEDLVMLVADPTMPFAWNAVSFPHHGYVWFSIRDPRVLRSTILWISNGGRHYAPWNGRHVNVMGIEDVTSYFHYGLAESAGRNPLSVRDIPTCFALDASRPTVIDTIQGVAFSPKGYGRVTDITAEPGGIALRDESGRKIHAPLDLSFLGAKR